MSFRNLSSSWVFRVYTPDLTPEQIKDISRPYVLKVNLPQSAEFLEVLQIESPLKSVAAGLAGMLQSLLAYSFLMDASDETTQPWFIICCFSNKEFAWHGTKLRQNEDIYCQPLGVSVHTGVPLLHIRTSLEHPGEDSYEKLEAELVEAGYAIAPAKLYDRSNALTNLYMGRKKESDGKEREEGDGAGTGGAEGGKED